MMRGRTLMRAVTNGRGTFIVAGGILGIGLYGFVVTFEPYASGRVLEPLRAVDGPSVTTWTSPLEILPAPVEVATASETGLEPAPQAPSEPRVQAAPAPAPTSAPAPVEAAGGDGGVTPLPPAPEPKPVGIGPIIIDAAAIPSLDTGPGKTKPPTNPAGPPAVDPAAPGPDRDDDEEGPAAGPSKGEDEGRGNGKTAGKSQGKARGQSK